MFPKKVTASLIHFWPSSIENKNSENFGKTQNSWREIECWSDPKTMLLIENSFLVVLRRQNYVSKKIYSLTHPPLAIQH